MEPRFLQLVIKLLYAYGEFPLSIALDLLQKQQHFINYICSPLYYVSFCL